MRLIIGGAGQGKQDYVKRTYGLTDADIARSLSEAEKALCLYGLETVIKEELSRQNDPIQQIASLIERNPSLIVISDEVGCGVVPIDREERLWRETVGRMCCRLAECAESVERIFCGISMKLK